MAPKRAPKKSAPPPPPPPAVSSEEEDSGSEESEDEDVSPTPVPSKPPQPPQKGQESESSDEEEDEEDGDEEEEEEASNKNKPPAPPQKDEESESSEEEEEEEPTRQGAPPSAKKNQPPPPQQSKESDAADEEGESSESDEEAPPPKPAPKRGAEDIKPPSAKKARGAFHRIWSTSDEVRILEALAAHQKQHGELPQPDALISTLAGKLDNHAYGSKELQSKLKAMKRRYVVLSNKGELPSKEHDRRLLDLSKIVWGGDKAVAATAKAASGHGLKGFEEMCELYPYLAEEVKKLEAAHPGMCKRVFGKMDDDKARAMDEKVKKQRVALMKVELHRTEVAKDVTKAIMELID